MARDPGTGSRPYQGWQGDIRPVMGMPILGKVWRAMGLPGPMPLVLENMIMPPGIAGYAPRGKGQVVMRPEFIDLLKTMPFPGHRNLAGLSVLAHEFAHTAQPQVLPKWREEGGAEAYTIDRFQRLLKALQIVPQEGDRLPGMGYPDWTTRMAREPHHSVRRGQFGR